MRGRGHSKLLIVICIVFAFLLSLLLQPLDTPTGLIVVTETLDISGSFTGIQVLNYSLTETPTRISFTGETTGFGLIWVEQDGSKFLIADFNNESFNDYCLESCDLSLKHGNFSVFIKVDSGIVNVQNIDYLVSRGGDIIDRENIIEEITKQPVEEEPIEEVIEEVVEKTADIIEKQPELKSSVPDVVLSLSASSADVDSTITMTCTRNANPKAKSTTLYWKDNSSGSFSTIPSSATDVDCNGSTCTQSNPTKGSGYAKTIMCEGAGTYGLRCDFVAGKSTYTSSVSSLTCSVANSAPSITTPPKDGGSSSSSPTNNNSDVTFSVTATDVDSDQYTLLVCSSNSQLSGSCSATTYCESSLTNSGVEASCTKSAARLGGSYSWYAFACDSNNDCSSSSQGSGITGSPFEVNRPPSVSSVAISPSTAYTASNLTGSGTFSDSDSDSSSSTYKWFKNKAVISGETSTSLGSGNFSKNDNLTFEYTPVDAHSYSGTTVNSSVVQIGNTEPITPTGLSLNSSIYISQVLTAVGSGSSDADSDSLTYYYEFHNINDDSTIQAHSTTATYTVASGDIHDTIRVRTKSYDGIAYSGEKEVNITVSNSVPSHSTPLMNASNPDNLTTRDLTCYPQGGSDADSDSLTYAYDWYKNNVSQGINNNVLDSANTSDDESWKCEVKPYDARDYGSPLNSSAVKIMPPLPSDFTDTSDTQEIYVDENVTFNATWGSNAPGENSVCKIKFKKLGKTWSSFVDMTREDSGNQFYKKMFDDPGGYKYKLKCGNQVTTRVVDVFHEEIDEFAGMTIDRKNERVYEPSAGKLSMFQSSKFFKNASGEFEDIDFTIDFCSGNYKRCITKGKFEAYFDKNASMGIMMKHNDTNVTFKMESVGYTIGGNYSASETRSSEEGGLENQGSYKYEGIFSNITAVYTYLANSIEKEINISVKPELKGTPGADDYFTIAINLTIPGMELTLDTESQVVYIRKDDDIKYKIPRAYAIDSNNSFKYLDYNVSGTMLYMNLNYDWFKFAVYPIIIDPSIQLTDTEDEADIHALDSGNKVEIQMKWDISSIPANKKIDDAKVCLYMYDLNGLQDSDATITRVDDQSWDETITNSSYDVQSETNSTSETWSSDTINTWTCLNVTTQLKEDYASSNTYSSVRLADPDYVMSSTKSITDSASSVNFGSKLNDRQLRPKEYSTSSQRPYLNVSYSNLTVVPNLENVTLTSTGSNKSSDNLTVSFDVSDPDGDSVFNTTDWRRNATSIAVVNMRLDFKNNSGVKDASSHSNDASVSSATWTSSGHLGGAYSFDGVNDYLEIGHSASLNVTDNITVMAWVKTDNEGYVIVKDVGSTTTNYEVFDGWESNSISSNWSVVTNDATYSSVDVQASGCSSPYAGTYYLWMDVTTNNNYVTNVLKTNFSMENASDIMIAFYHKETGEESHQVADHSGDTPCAAGSSGACGDGVFFTCNGTYWYRLESLTTVETNWGLHDLDVSADSDFCADVTSDFGLKIMQHDNYKCSSDGRGFDNLNITYKVVDVNPSSEVPFVLSTLNGGEFSIINSSTEYNVTYSGDLNDGNWHLLTGTYTKGNLSLYVDGTYQGSNTDFNGLLPTTPGAVWVGRNYTTASSSGYFNGTIDDVRIFDRVLTAEQIKLFFENDTRTLYSGETIIGDNWTVSVTSSDYYSETAASTSNHLIIDPQVSCGDIITADTNMDQDVIGCSGDYIVNITASNVDFDCKGYTLNGTATRGINAMNVENLTIKNCDISKTGSNGIFFHTVSTSTVDNNTVNVSSSYPLGINFGGRNTFTNNTCEAGSIGVLVSGSHNNTIQDNTFIAVNRALYFKVAPTDGNQLINTDLKASSSKIISGSSPNGYIVYKNSFGVINWSSIEILEAGDLVFGTNPIISSNNIYFDRDAIPTLNNSANLTLFNISILGTAKPFRDGSVCSDSICSSFTNVSDDYYFSVTRFSNYSVDNIPNSNKFVIENSTGAVVASVDDVGNVYLKGSLLQSQSSLVPGSNSFIVQNNTGGVVAYFADNGSLFLSGALTEQSSMSLSISALQFRNSSNDLVGYVDNTGAMKISGEVSENFADP